MAAIAGIALASYTAQQYADQRRVRDLINKANRTGRCPQCGQPQGRWPDGAARVTCGAMRCYRAWLNAAKEQTEDEHASEVH